MKTPYPHILSCIAVSILTACGGGGGGGTPSVAPTPTYPIVQPGNIPNPSGQTEKTATPPAGNQADANNALEASEENIHKEVEDSVNSTQTSSENQNQDVKADSNDKAEAERKAAEEAAKAKAEAERKAAEEAAKAKAEAERKAAEEAAKVKAEEERKAAEEAAKAKAEEERKAAEEVTPKAEVAPAMQSIGGFYTMLSVDGADNKVINRVGNPDVLEVNGQKINLLPQTFDAANGMLSLSDNKIIRAIGTHLQYGHYGFYGSKKDNGELNSSLVFYQGLMTPVEAMPQTGSAIYQGNAFYNDASNINTVGSSLFNVDFGEKSLTGGVYSAEGRFNPVMLQANIAGNRFVYVDGTTKNSMSGIFLGPQAEEMAGRFDHPSEGKSGTFGAAMLKD